VGYSKGEGGDVFRQKMAKAEPGAVYPGDCYEETCKVKEELMRGRTDKFRKRVFVFGIIFSFLVGGLLLTRVQALAAEGEILVAHLDDYSGPYAESSKMSYNSYTLFLEETGGKLGPFKVKLITRDTELKPAVGVRRLQEILETEKPFFIVSGESSAVQLAMQDVIGKAKSTIFWTGGMDTKLTGEKGNRYSFRWSGFNYPYAKGAALKFLQLNPSVRKIITLMPDYTWGYDMMALLEPVLAERNVQILKKQWIPVTSTDASPFMLEAKQSGADAYIQLGYGTLFANCLKQTHEFGLKKNMKIFNLDHDLTMMPSIGCEALEGTTSVDLWYFGMDNEWSKKFTAKFQKRFGIPPDQLAATGYITMQIMDKVLHKTGKADPKVVIPALENFGEYEGPNGKERLVGWYHQCEHDLVMLEGKPCKEMKNNWDFMKITGRPGVWPKQGEKGFEFDRRKEPL
jgi:branched-chain amino acid transport system substrate-binding protein